MSTENIIHLLPTIIFLAIMVWLLLRMRRSYQIQSDSAKRQKEMTPRLIESVELQKAGIELARKQLEATHRLIEEISSLRKEWKG